MLWSCFPEFSLKNIYEILQRRHTDGQSVHKKKLNITNYQGNANQYHKEISPHPYQNGYHQKETQITNIGEDLEKREL